MAQTARTPLLVRLLFVVALVFTAIGIVECLFIVADLATGSLSATRAPDLGLGIRSWTEHHAMRPGYGDPNNRTNSFGLRGPEVTIPKPEGTFRILLLGDSFTYGFKALYESTFARRLDLRLHQAFPGKSIEIVNAGVLSYCPLLEYLQYRHHLHVLEPDLVVLNFDMSDVQDQMDYARSLVRSSTGVPLFVTEPSLNRSPSAMPGLLSFEWISRRFTGLTRRVESSREGIPFARDLDRYLWTLDGGPEWENEVQAALDPIADLQALLAHHKIPLILATYPQPWQVAADATPSEPLRKQYGVGLNTVHLNDRSFRKIQQFAEKQGLLFINATETFRKDSSPASLYLPDDFHFSPRGNDVYAAVLERFLIDRGLVK